VCAEKIHHQTNQTHKLKHLKIAENQPLHKKEAFVDLGVLFMAFDLHFYDATQLTVICAHCSYYINYLTKAMQLEDPRGGRNYKQLQNERCSTESIPLQVRQVASCTFHLNKIQVNSIQFN